MANKPRKTVQIDEHQLREMMAGDLPNFKFREPGEEKKEIDPVPVSHPDQTSGLEQTCKDLEEYEKIFLTRSPTVNRRHTYISLDS